MKYIILFLLCCNVFADNLVKINETGNNNSILVDQIGSGHIADLTLSGDNKTVNIYQEGITPQTAIVNLYGVSPISVSISQTGAGNNTTPIDITSTCTAATSCGTITIQSNQ